MWPGCDESQGLTKFRNYATTAPRGWPADWGFDDVLECSKHGIGQLKPLQAQGIYTVIAGCGYVGAGCTVRAQMGPGAP